MQFSALTKIIIDTALLPVAVIKDVLTLGGVTTDQPMSYTAQKIDDIKQDADDAD